ncbi:hypothetical protein [Streptomyces xanthochromogenes]|uniref:hypothetical protein n=1 Tax=Streptomyces xanthochromogenes TaxID=67384 RepID=UPI001672E4EF|nr:hypothetical protein [Streptomyces xanthochromogenes]
MDHQQQKHTRKYRRRQRAAPVPLWQMDIVSGVPLTDGRLCKLVTGLDDEFRVVMVVVRPTDRDLCLAFVVAMQRYGVPPDMLTGNDKQFTSGSTKPRPPRCCSGTSADRTASCGDQQTPQHRPRLRTSCHRTA